MIPAVKPSAWASSARRTMLSSNARFQELRNGAKTITNPEVNVRANILGAAAEKLKQSRLDIKS